MFAPWRHDIACAPWNAAVACGEACLHVLISRYISTGFSPLRAPGPTPPARSLPRSRHADQAALPPRCFHCCPGSLARRHTRAVRSGRRPTLRRSSPERTHLTCPARHPFNSTATSANTAASSPPSPNRMRNAIRVLKDRLVKLQEARHSPPKASKTLRLEGIEFFADATFGISTSYDQDQIAHIARSSEISAIRHFCRAAPLRLSPRIHSPGVARRHLQPAEFAA
jgi:hypothetical protein